jgi:hypothetical protein
MDELAKELMHLKRYEESLTMLEDVFERRSRVIEAENSDILLAMSSIAAVLSHLDRFDESDNV